MKKSLTSSEYVFILSDIDKTIVRKYKQKNNKWNLSCLKQKEIFKLIEHSNIKHPAFLKNKIKYYDMEFVRGKLIDSTFDKRSLSGLISNYIYELRKIDCSKISKKSKWKTSTDFFQNLVKQTLNNIKKSKTEEKLKLLGLSSEVISSYLNVTLDNQRTLSLIHGDMVKENILNDNGVFYLLDWDKATYGDMAYDLALHFITEDYSKDEIGSIIERICGSNGINQTNLIRDISLYIEFEYKRRSVKDIIECIDYFKRGKNYNFILERLYNIYSKIPNCLSKDEVKKVIES